MRTCRATSLALLLAATLGATLPAAPAQAATLNGVTLPDKIDAGGQSLVLNGLALRTKFFVKVYVGGLYLTHKEHDAAKVLAEDAPRRMVLSFLYGVSTSQMCDAWKDGLAANTPHAAPDVKKAFDTLCTHMEDIPKGQTMTFTYVPGQGTTVEVKGKAKGTLPGKPTADAILSTWIGPKPDPGQDFKKGVLGQ
ncbi:MAG TPA: chalcone isomerase family protein [Thermoanaerobaculia bacterium]|nr:chalcone isomerase family protein [Thermoanaerobaculia bacterium]